MPSHRESCRSEADSQGELVLLIYMRYQACSVYQAHTCTYPVARQWNFFSFGRPYAPIPAGKVKKVIFHHFSSLAFSQKTFWNYFNCQKAASNFNFVVPILNVGQRNYRYWFWNCSKLWRQTRKERLYKNVFFPLTDSNWSSRDIKRRSWLFLVPLVWSQREGDPFTSLGVQDTEGSQPSQYCQEGGFWNLRYIFVFHFPASMNDNPWV